MNPRIRRSVLSAMKCLSPRNYQPRAARINESGCRAAPGNVLCVYPKTRGTPVDMSVEIDQPWTHDAARNILNLLGLNRTVAVQNRRDLAICESNILVRIQATLGSITRPPLRRRSTLPVIRFLA